MKKFFSLVLALVMALSLTTVAWGAGETCTTAAPCGHVAEVGGLHYTDLQEALNQGGTVTLLSDVTYDTVYVNNSTHWNGDLNYELNVGKDVVLDLNGYTIKTTGGSSHSYFALICVRSGSLTIQDSSTAKTGAVICSAGTIAKRAYTIYNNAALTLNGGTISNTVGNYAIESVTVNNTALTINDGATVTSTGIAVRVCSEGSTKTQTVAINGGAISGTYALWVPLKNSGGNDVINLTISGGELTGSSNAVLVSASANASVSTDFTTDSVAISGGTFTGDVLIGSQYSDDDTNKALSDALAGNVITGGTFSNDVSDYVAPGESVTMGGTSYTAPFSVSTAAELITAMKAVTPGATIVLLDDITITQDWDCRTPAKGGVGATFTVPVTIDGNDKTLKFTGKVFDGYNHLCAFRFEADATVKNLTIDMSEAVSGWDQRLRAISAKENLTVDNCEFYGNPNYNNTRAIIFAEGQQVHSDVEISVTNSVFKDWTYGLTDNENGKDVKSVSASDNTFTDAGVQLSASEEVVFNDNTVDGGKVTITSYAATNELSVTATGNTLGANTTVTVSKAATVTTDSNAFIATDATLTAPDGYQVLKTTTGAEVVVPAVGGDKYDLYAADSGMKVALAAGAEDVAGLSFTQVAAVTNSDGSGNLAYIAANNGECYVKTSNPTIADYAVTVAGKTDVLYYVSVVDAADMAYGATATAFTNFGKSCGQLYRVDTTKEYYVIEKAEVGFALAKGDVSYVVNPAARASYVNVLVGNEIKTVAPVAVDDTNKTLTIDEILAHNWAVTGVQALPTGVTYPTEVKCLNCGAVVTTLYKDSSLVPAGNDFIDVPGYTNSWVFVEPAASYVGGSVVTPGTVVESAPTFDAGIATYVGMSVMAAAGSAVVIGKKRED